MWRASLVHLAVSYLLVLLCVWAPLLGTAAAPVPSATFDLGAQHVGWPRIRHHHRPPRAQRSPHPSFAPLMMASTSTSLLAPSSSRRSGGGGGGGGGGNGGWRASRCPRPDVGRRAFRANTVVRAKAESMSSNRVHNFSVTFRVLERFKSPAQHPLDDKLRLTFSGEARGGRGGCEEALTPRGSGAGALVRARIEQSKEYFLFLDGYGRHNYSVVGAPVPARRRPHRNKDVETTIRRVTARNFVPRKPKKPKIISNRTENLRPNAKLRLICKVKGFPVPSLSWMKNDRPLHRNSRIRVTYNKRRTTLVVNRVQGDDGGVYQCVATGVDNNSAKTEVQVRISNRDECKDQLKENYCLNGGTCVKIIHKEVACMCPDGFTGQRCDEKDVSSHSSEGTDWTTPITQTSD